MAGAAAKKGRRRGQGRGQTRERADSRDAGPTDTQFVEPAEAEVREETAHASKSGPSGKRPRQSGAGAGGGAAKRLKKQSDLVEFRLRRDGDLQACIDDACARLRNQHHAETARILGKALQRAHEDPARPPACFLLIGPRGSGKSATVDEALRSTPCARESSTGSSHDNANGAEATEDMLATPPKSVVPNRDEGLLRVDLHGLLHTSKLNAMRAVAAGLTGHARCNRRKGTSRSNRSEGSVSCADFDNGALRSAEIATCTASISCSLACIKQAGQMVVFVVDDFDRFAQPGAAQPVLYDILNLMQDSELRAVCIGMTAQVDAADGLEKRVRSRFCPREIVLMPKDSPDAVTEALLTALTSAPGSAKASKGLAKTAQRKQQTEFSKVMTEFMYSKIVQDAIRERFCVSRAMGCFVAAMCDCLSSATVQLEELAHIPSKVKGHKATEIYANVDARCFARTLNPSGCENGLEGLSVLDASLLGALRRLEAVPGSRPGFDFRQVYEEYSLLQRGGERGFVDNREDGEPIAEVPVAEKAWQRIEESGLVACIAGSSAPASAEFALMVDPSDVDSAISDHPTASGLLKRWAKGVAT